MDYNNLGNTGLEEIAALETPYVPHPVNGIVPPLGSGPLKLTLLKE
jgi:hypothetical protein